MVEETQQEQIELKGPGGVGLNLKGTGSQVLGVLLIAAVGVFLWYTLDQHEQHTATRQTESVKQWHEVKKAMQEVKEVQTAQLYVLTLDQKDRAKLQLNKPKALRDLERE